FNVVRIVVHRSVIDEVTDRDSAVDRLPEGAEVDLSCLGFRGVKQQAAHEELVLPCLLENEVDERLLVQAPQVGSQVGYIDLGHRLPDLSRSVRPGEGGNAQRDAVLAEDLILPQGAGARKTSLATVQPQP